MTSRWDPGRSEPTADERNALDVVASAANLTGMKVIVSVFNADSSTTPLSSTDQQEFASYAAAIARDNPSIRDVVIGNEPNLNRFWMPQFGTNGTDAAATAYEALLAKTYDALKAVSSQVNVIGVAVSPRGSDNPAGIRPTHSPTAFITDLGRRIARAAASSRSWTASASTPTRTTRASPPSFAHPNNTTIAIADYGKLVALLGKAFDGTAQPGSTLPIVYGEFGVETTIPSQKSALYTGTSRRPSSPSTSPRRAASTAMRSRIAFCQPNVIDLPLLPRDRRGRTSTAGSRGSTTSTERRSRASRTSRTRRATCAAA